MNYDYIIVGSGLFGSVFAYEANRKGKKCLVLEKRDHIGGNIYTEKNKGINVHKYGAHIFHTSNDRVWRYINKFATFNNYINTPIAIYKDEVYNLPFNMNTFNKLWGIKTPDEAVLKIEVERKKYSIDKPKNLEEKAISLVGYDIYEKLIKGYTEKQWGKKCNELPEFIINRLPVRFTYDNNYFNDTYQGIPIGGYTQIIEKMLSGIEVKLNCDFFKEKEKYLKASSKIVFTGMLDEYFEYKFGPLEYRSLKFENEIVYSSNFQGNAVVNYTEFNVPYTRIIEHKHFEFDLTTDVSVITKEFPANWNIGDEPYYPINNKANNDLFNKYWQLTENTPNVIFGGRLGQYKYFDMDDVIEAALECVKGEFGE